MGKYIPSTIVSTTNTQVGTCYVSHLTNDILDTLSHLCLMNNPINAELFFLIYEGEN